MIGAIVRKEVTEYRRDGRALAMLGLIAVLVTGSLVTGWSVHVEQRRQVRQAQRDDQATFLGQGEKPHHSAAHFGRMAYKPVPPLAVFDAGAASYLGQVIWLEAHRRDPAMFRPAEDSPELRRLADLSVAGVLTMLVPLLTFLIGHGAFAAERERGTLRQVMSAGPGIGNLFVGKILAVAAVPVGISLVTVTVSTVLAMTAPESVSVADTAARGAGLVVGYSLYSVSLAALALLVSSRARSATSALLVLLSLWAGSVVILPRVAASIAQRAYPTPDSAAFWAEAADAIDKNRPRRDSLESREVQQLVLSRALGRNVSADEAASMRIDRRGLALEVSEILGAKAYAEAYRTLYATYDDQQRVRRFFTVFSPAVSLQHFSSSLAGTDIVAHRHFSDEAERQRNVIIRAMNDDMMLNEASASESALANADFWLTVPDFEYAPPPASFAIRNASMDFVVLAAWSVLSLALAWWGASRQRVV